MGEKILVVITNHRDYPSGKKSTGLWFSELSHFYDILHKEGYKMDFVSPEGGEIPIDPVSTGKGYLDKSAKGYFTNPEFMELLKDTMPAADVKIDEYSALYFTGGHGTMWDFPENEVLHEFCNEIYENGGVVAAVCHGCGGIMNACLEDGDYLISGKSITGFSNFEENFTGVKGQLPFLLEDELKRRGAKYKKAFLPFTSKVVTDGRIVTGQNPQSVKGVARSVVYLLRKT